MSGGGMPVGALGLAEFIAALRAELGVAQHQALADDDPLKLQVGPVELELEVGFTVEAAGEATAGVKAKFWVFELGSVSLKGSRTVQDVRTQHVKVTLTPRLEWRVTDTSGATSTWTAPVDVEGRLGAGEDGAGPLPEPQA